MYKNHEQLDPVDDTLTVWKYMSLNKFVNLILTGTLHFNRIDNFEDIYEGTYPIANVVQRGKVYGESFPPQEMYDAIVAYEKVRLYVACFHINGFESAAMWKLYAKDSGLAIKTTVKRLKECFHNENRDIEIAAVTYIDYAKDFLPEGNMFYLGTHKRKSFAHEQEIRCLYLNHGDTFPETGQSMVVDVNTLIEEIYISPYAPSYMKGNVEELCKRCGYTIPIIKSTLYELSK